MRADAGRVWNANLELEKFMKIKDLELNILLPENRISATQLAAKLTEAKRTNQQHLLVDVRNEAQFNMCRIDGAVNCSIDYVDKCHMENLIEAAAKGDVTFVCRRGNDSQIVAQKLIDAVPELSSRIKDLTGGLHAWSREVDPEFPIY